MLENQKVHLLSKKAPFDPHAFLQKKKGTHNNYFIATLHSRKTVFGLHKLMYCPLLFFQKQMCFLKTINRIDCAAPTAMVLSTLGHM